MKLLSKVVVLVSLLVITGCNSSQPAVTVPREEPASVSPSPIVQEEITDRPVPVATITPVNTPTPVPSSTPTATSTATILPADTATVTPTATPDRAVPGVYAGNCAKYRVGYYLNVDFCVDGIDVLLDYSMQYYISWSFQVIAEPGGYAGPYLFRPEHEHMYLIDNLGNRYGPLSAKYFIVSAAPVEGNVMRANVFFPPVRVGARTFTLFDDKFDTSMRIDLTEPLHIYDFLALQHSPFTLRYQIKYWQVSTNADGNEILTHLTIDKCAISEVYPSTPQGTLINNIKIGEITYNIYRYYGQDMSVREYQVVAGVEGIDPDAPPLVSVNIPLDNAQQCILDASEVLANLQPATPANP